MRKTIKTILLIALLGNCLPSVWGFSLLGPIKTGDPGTEPWQIPTIGYNIGGDIGGPHNWGEEYRRVTPTLYYAYDANFLGWFGTVGATNVDGAFAIMNALTNASSYSPTLTEVSPMTQSYNATAQALYLTDIKSVTLYLLVEQMGLDQPERFTWTLHDRQSVNTLTCPLNMAYTVVQRNFDTYDLTGGSQIPYSAYVDEILYTYYIIEECTGPNPLAVTDPITVDPNASQVYGSVAGFDLQLGGFYTGLSRDDIAGLVYLMNSNNINREATASSGGQLLITNTLAQQTLTTLPLSLLFGQANFTPPSILTNLYPGISYLSVQTNLLNLFTTNITAYFTNLPGPYTNSGPNFTNWSPIQYGGTVPTPTLSLAAFIAAVSTNDPLTLLSLYPNLILSNVITNAPSLQTITNFAIYFTNQTALPVYTNLISGGLRTGNWFTNQPGPTVINYPPSTQLFTNYDLYTFSQLAQVTDPVTLQGLYPGLVILSYSYYQTNLTVTNQQAYYIPVPLAPYGTEQLVFSNIVTTTYPNIYTYTFGNVVTNHYYTNAYVTTSTTVYTNLALAPYSTNYLQTVYTSYYTNKPSGDILIIPTNWCGFQVFGVLSTNAGIGYSNLLTSAAFTNTQTTATIQYAKYQFYTTTNYVYSVKPGICEPVLTNSITYSTNIVNTYQFSFGNVVTNHYYPTTYITVLTTNVYSVPWGSTNSFVTNITASSFYTNLPSGDIFIVPSTWCGYKYTTLLASNNAVTNFFTAPGVTNVGQYYNQVTISYFTNYYLNITPGFCEPTVAFTTNYTTNPATVYNYVFSGIITNRYNPNTLATVITTNLAAVTNGLVGALTNLVTTNYLNIGVTGDFFVVPPAWCGLTILSTLSSSVNYATNQFAATNVLGIPTLGENYSQTTISSYTNSTFNVLPQVCSTVAPSPNLRRGIEKVQFIRANYDSLIGQFFAPITNYYTMTVITNSQQITEYYQRIITTPDILLTSSDQATIPGNATIGVGTLATRSIAYDSSQVLAGEHGPGTIYGPTVFTFNEVGPIFLNGPVASTNAFLSQFTQGQSQLLPNFASLLQWASFDGSTNPIILYPSLNNLTNLANSIYIQVSPQILPAGNNGTYYSQTFSATGGQPPYTWSAPNISSLVPGISFNGNPSNPTIYGTPNVSGTFSFSIQLTDSINHTVTYNYTLTIN